IGKRVEATSTYGRAFEAAVASGDDGTAARASAARIILLAFQGPRDEARASLPLALHLAERLGDKQTTSELIYADGRMHADEGDWAGAGARADRAYAIRVALFGTEHPSVAQALSGRGLANRMLGRLAEGRADTERALAIDERLFGPDHP